MSPLLSVHLHANAGPHTLLDMDTLKCDLHQRVSTSKHDMAAIQKEYIRRCGHFFKELPSHLKHLPTALNLAPEDMEEFEALSDEELCAKYRAIRVAVSSSMTGALINTTLIPFLPTHAIGAVLNCWQTSVTLINRKHAKQEITRRMALNDEAAQLFVIQLDGTRGRAQDVCVGIFVKGALIAATMGFVDLLAIPANADALVPAMHHGSSTLLTALGHNTPAPTGATGSTATAAATAHATVEQIAHEHLKAHGEALTATHPLLVHAPLDSAGLVTDNLSHGLAAANAHHFGIAAAPQGSSGFADLISLHHHGLPTDVLLGEVALVGATAEITNVPAVVGDYVLENRWEAKWKRHWAKLTHVKEEEKEAEKGEEKEAKENQEPGCHAVFLYETLDPKKSEPASPMSPISPSPLSSPSSTSPASPSPPSSLSSSRSMKRKPVPSQLSTSTGISSCGQESANLMSGYSYRRRRAGEDLPFFVQG